MPIRSTTRSLSPIPRCSRARGRWRCASTASPRSRLLEYQCHSEDEEASGAFERDPKTWYPGPSVAVTLPPEWKDDAPATPWKAPAPTGAIKRLPDGKPDLQGFFLSDTGGANYGLGKHERDFLTPEGRGVIVDPADGVLPLQEWA